MRSGEAVFSFERIPPYSSICEMKELRGGNESQVRIKGLSKVYTQLNSAQADHFYFFI